MRTPRAVNETKFGLLPFDNFSDAIGVNSNGVRPPEEKDHAIILGRADVPGFTKSVLRAVVQSDGKRSERVPLARLTHPLGFEQTSTGAVTHQCLALSQGRYSTTFSIFLGRPGFEEICEIGARMTCAPK